MAQIDEQYLTGIAKTGQIPVSIEWRELGPKLKQYMNKNMEIIVDPVLKTPEFHDILKDINDSFDEIDEIPWTIQRLCELIVWPTQHYSNIIKYLRAVRKTLQVTTPVSRPLHHIMSNESPMILSA